MARFKTGQQRPPSAGRKKGSKNSKTVLLDTFAQSVAEGGMDKFMAELKTLKGSAYVNAYLQVFEYVKPKLSRATVEGGDIDKPVRIIIQGAK